MANRPMFAVLATFAAIAIAAPAMAQPIQGGVDMNVDGSPTYTGGAQAYPMPKMIGQPVKTAPVTPPPKKPPKKLQATVQQQAPPPQQRPPIQASAQASPPPGVLPTQFMGNWLVIGQRQQIQARPEYQNGIDSIFTSSNSQTWNIVGQPNAYSMSSSTGVQSVQVGQCNNTTAFLRYQHPIKNTVAQEAIVMQLAPDGMTFQGMQRITIKKQGEPTPRAQVTYQLMGRRQ